MYGRAESKLTKVLSPSPPAFHPVESRSLTYGTAIHNKYSSPQRDFHDANDTLAKSFKISRAVEITRDVFQLDIVLSDGLMKLVTAKDQCT